MTSATPPRLHTHVVIIPHYNDVARLDRCLTALQPQITPQVDVVVADNNSTDPLTDVQARHGWARFVTEPDAGAALARNRGVAESTAQGLIFLDADCVPGPDWLQQALRVGAPGMLVGGRVDVFDETPPPRSGAEAFETVFAFDQKDYVARKGFSVTANLVTTRAVFDQTGPFINGVSEDADWCFRATALGHRLIYEDALAVAHPSRQDWPALAKKWRRLTREMYGLNGQGVLARLKWALKGAAMPLSILVHAPRIFRHPALTPRERLRGLGTLARLRLTRGAWMIRQALSGKP